MQYGAQQKEEVVIMVVPRKNPKERKINNQTRCLCTEQDGKTKLQIIDYLYDAITNALIISKFFLDGLIFPIPDTLS